MSVIQLQRNHRRARDQVKPRPFHQTYIGFTAQNTLTFVDRLKVPRGESFILKLPDELLSNIFEFATSYSEGEEYTDYWQCDDQAMPSESEAKANISTIKTLILTCHRFHRIAILLQYHVIRLWTPRWRSMTRFNRGTLSTKAVKSLHQTLQKNPFLHQHCRVLVINVHGPEAEMAEAESQKLFLAGDPDKPRLEIDVDKFSIFNDLVAWLKGLRCLSVTHAVLKDIEPTCALIRNAIQHLDQLKHLTISKPMLIYHAMRRIKMPYMAQLEYLKICDPVTAYEVMEHIDLPSLETLHVNQLRPASSITEPKNYQTASFYLVYIGFSETVEDVTHLIKWPKKLTRFFLEKVADGYTGMSLSILHTALLSHKDTLKLVDIEYLPASTQGSSFVVSDFPKLEAVGIPRYQTEDEDLDLSSVDADSLLAPNLKSFKWYFERYRYNPVLLTDFGEREEDWIRKFVMTAIHRKVLLEEINIAYAPRDWQSNCKEEDGYPWDRMDKIRNEIRPHGIQLVYNKPDPSKEDWLQCIRDAKERQSRSERGMRSGDIRKHFPEVVKK